MTILSKIIRKTSYFINKVLFKFIYKFFFLYKGPPGDYCEREIPDPIRTRKSSLSAPMVLCLKTWKSRTLPGFKKL